jgi:hypothetical protein
MTSTELKAQIDSQITNETTANAITPTDVGTNLKDIVDYVDQQDELSEVLTNKSTNVTTDGASDIKYPSVKAVKTYVDANGGLSFVSVDSNSFDGNGTPATPLKNKVYYRTSQIFASAGGAPQRSKNFFNGMQLPDGVTETFTRVSSGIYRATYSGASTVADLDLSNASKLFHFSFSSMPTNTGSDLKIQSIGSTNSGGTRTIFVEFHNLPGDVLTDDFGGYLYYEVNFYQ